MPPQPLFALKNFLYFNESSKASGTHRRLKKRTRDLELRNWVQGSYPAPVNGRSRLTYSNIWRDGPPGRRANQPTWQVPDSQAAQSVHVHKITETATGLTDYNYVSASNLPFPSCCCYSKRDKANLLRRTVESEAGGTVDRPDGSDSARRHDRQRVQMQRVRAVSHEEGARRTTPQSPFCLDRPKLRHVELAVFQLAAVRHEPLDVDFGAVCCLQAASYARITVRNRPGRRRRRRWRWRWRWRRLSGFRRAAGGTLLGRLWTSWKRRRQRTRNNEPCSDADLPPVKYKANCKKKDIYNRAAMQLLRHYRALQYASMNFMWIRQPPTQATLQLTPTILKSRNTACCLSTTPSSRPTVDRHTW